MIRARDPRLCHISVAVPGFLLPEGAPIPEGTLLTQPITAGDLASQTIPEGIPKEAFPLQPATGESTSSRPTNREEGEDEEEKEKEIVDISDLDDIYEVFYQP